MNYKFQLFLLKLSIKKQKKQINKLFPQENKDLEITNKNNKVAENPLELNSKFLIVKKELKIQELEKRIQNLKKEIENNSTNFKNELKDKDKVIEKYEPLADIFVCGKCSGRLNFNFENSTFRCVLCNHYAKLKYSKVKLSNMIEYEEIAMGVNGVYWRISQ